MSYDETTLNRIRNYGALKYKLPQIARLLQLTSEEEELLLIEFEQPNSIIRKYYELGVELGGYNIDAELAKLGEGGDIEAIKELTDRQHQRGLADLKKRMFGI